MKTLRIYQILFMAVLAACFTACSDDKEKFEPVVLEGAQVYFPTPTATIELDKTSTSFNIAVARAEAAGSLTANLSVSDASGKFSIPSSVSFAEGETSAQLTITYNPADFAYDQFETVTLSISEVDGTPYGSATCMFQAGIPAPWESLGMATYVEDCVTTFFDVENLSYQVEIQENMENRGVYRLVNPYGKAYSYNEEGDYDASKNYYMEIDARDPEGVLLKQSRTGMDWGYGEFVIWSWADYNMGRGATLEDMKAAGYCGTLKDGIITFPPKSLLIAMLEYNDGGLSYSNLNGAFKVAMPGAVLADYTAEVAYLGRFTNVDYENFVVASVTLGEDVESAKVALVPGKDVDAAAAGIIDGSIEAETLTADGTVSVKCKENGTYSFVVVTYGAGEAREVAATSFDYAADSSSPFDDLQTGVAIDDYVGQWLVPVADGSGYARATVTKVDEQTLAVGGMLNGYDDTFYLDYDATSGWLSFYAQNAAPFQGKDALLAFITSDNGFDTSDALIGSLNSKGQLTFVNAMDNEAKCVSFAFAFIEGTTANLFTPLLGFTWERYVPETRSVGATPMKPRAAFYSTAKVLGKQVDKTSVKEAKRFN